MSRLNIRKSRREDLPAMLAIYAYARQKMKENGNPNQWITYPKREILENDLALDRSYVLTDGERVCGTFVFFVGNDPTYDVIEGTWLNDDPYGVIHRIASDGTNKGILHEAVAFAKRFTGNLRIDTHADNVVMQNALQKEGFSKAGIIYVKDDTSDHSPRIAYQKVLR